MILSNQKQKFCSHANHSLLGLSQDYNKIWKSRNASYHMAMVNEWYGHPPGQKPPRIKAPWTKPPRTKPPYP